MKKFFSLFMIVVSVVGVFYTTVRPTESFIPEGLELVFLKLIFICIWLLSCVIFIQMYLDENKKKH